MGTCPLGKKRIGIPKSRAEGMERKSMTRGGKLAIKNIGRR